MPDAARKISSGNVIKFPVPSAGAAEAWLHPSVQFPKGRIRIFIASDFTPSKISKRYHFSEKALADAWAEMHAAMSLSEAAVKTAVKTAPQRAPLWASVALSGFALAVLVFLALIPVGGAPGSWAADLQVLAFVLAPLCLFLAMAGASRAYGPDRRDK